MSSKCTPEYNDKTRAMMDELEKLKAQAHEVARNIARERQLNKQSEELRAKRDAGDTSRPPKREPPVYDERVTHALIERNRLRNQVENLIAKGDRLNRSPVQKILGTVHDVQMAMILASLHVFKKLGYAVGGGHVGSLIADTTRSVAKHVVPGLKGIAEQAPQYGRGLDLDALKARWQGIKEAPRQALNQLQHGEATREEAFGNSGRLTDEYMTFAGTLADALKTPGVLNKVSETTRALAGYVGRTHAAEKEFLAQPEFREGLVRESKSMVADLEKQGMTPEQIAAVMTKESTQAAIGTKALERAYKSKMQGKNSFSSAVDAMIGTLDRSDSGAANFAGFLIKTLFPIRKVGVNIAIRQSQHLVGGAKALVAAFKKGEMTPERADYIMENVGRQGVGAALLTAGILYYNKFGGVPGVFSKKDQPQQKDAEGNPIKPNEADGFGTEAFHGAEFALLQIGASMMQVFQKEHGKEQGTDLALDVVLKPTLNWYVRTIPYTDAFRRWTNTMEYGRARKEGVVAGLGEIAGDTARSMVVPGVVQQYAAEHDDYKGFRHPRNIKEDIQLGIPGQREKVPKK